MKTLSEQLGIPKTQTADYTKGLTQFKKWESLEQFKKNKGDGFQFTEEVDIKAGIQEVDEEEVENANAVKPPLLYRLLFEAFSRPFNSLKWSIIYRYFMLV